MPPDLSPQVRANCALALCVLLCGLRHDNQRSLFEFVWVGNACRRQAKQGFGEAVLSASSLSQSRKGSFTFSVANVATNAISKANRLARVFVGLGYMAAFYALPCLQAGARRDSLSHRRARGKA